MKITGQKKERQSDGSNNEDRKIGGNRIGVIDFGGQYTHLIARRIRKLGVYSEVLPPSLSLAQAREMAGLIFSGGPHSVYDDGAPSSIPDILQAGIPILGLCYGHQLICSQRTGEVKRGAVHEFGPADFHPQPGHPLFSGMSSSSVVWMSHGDEVVRLPPGFRQVGSTAHCSLAAVADDTLRIYGLQFHPEVTHTIEGEKILDNFLGICGVDRDWKVEHFAQELERKLLSQCKDKKVFLLVSGGVDSTVAFALLNKALGPDRVLGLHIDNGLMRKDESGEVLAYLNKEGFHNLVVKDASDKFLDRLRNAYSPEAKRKIIGDTFLEVKNEELLALSLDPENWLLAQGTIYPDTIESGGTNNAATIKTHHNRVEAVRELIAKGLVVEPLADLYKDEVRELGLSLGIPESLIWRHPFPGPGLGVRLLCNEHPHRTLSPEIHFKIQSYLRKFEAEGEVLPVESVGVQGDARTYAHPCLVRGVRNWEEGDRLSTLITNHIREVNRVVLEVGKAEEEAYRLIPLKCEKANLDFLREVDHICSAFLYEEALYALVWQMPVVLLPLVLGGKPVVVLRPVVSSEAMTARFATLPFPLLDKLWEKLKKAGVGAVLYDITHKPPGTIEWE